MSYTLVNQALAMPLPPARRMVLLALADMANATGVCWPSIATLAHRACMSVRSVFNHLKALVKAGLIQRRPRIGRSSLYMVTGQVMTTSAPAAIGAASTPTTGTDRATSAPAPAIAPTVLTVGSVVQAMREVGMLGSYDCAPLAALVGSASPTNGMAEFTSVASEAVAKKKGFAWVLTVIKARRSDRAQADTARCTVPGMVGRDPVLIQLEQDAAKSSPPPASIRERLARLKAEIVGAVAGSTAGAGA